MPAMNIKLDGSWPDLIEKIKSGKLIDITGPGAPEISLNCIPNGTVEGNPTVAIRIDLPDGRTVLTETTLALFLSAADAFKARFGDPRVKRP